MPTLDLAVIISTLVQFAQWAFGLLMSGSMSLLGMAPKYPLITCCIVGFGVGVSHEISERVRQEAASGLGLVTNLVGIMTNKFKDVFKNLLW